MKGWNSTDDTRFPYYHPGTATQYPKSRKSVCTQNENYYQRTSSDDPNMTQLDYFPPNGMCLLK